MAVKLQNWLDVFVKHYAEMSISQLGNIAFFRDPPRPQFIDHNYFFSPADGIILYQKLVEKEGTLLEVKGEKYTIEDLFQGEVEFLPALVIGVFMSFFDCVKGGSLVYTSNGIKEVKDLVGTKGQILTEYGPKGYKDVIYKGKREVLTVRTKHHREITVTPDHQLRVLDSSGDGLILSWKMAKDIRKGDVLLLKLNGEGIIPDLNPEGPTLDEAYLVGYLWGDGCLTRTGQMIWVVPQHEQECWEKLLEIFVRNDIPFQKSKHFTYDFPDGVRVVIRKSFDSKGVTEEEVLRKYQQIKSSGKLNKNWRKYAETAKRHQQKTGDPHTCGCLYYLTTTSKRLRKLFPAYQSKGQWKSSFLAHNPSWSSKQYAAFLKALFTTDGHITKANGRDVRSELVSSIGVAAKYWNLIKDVRQLLSLLGINTTLNVRKKNTGYGGGSIYTALIIGSTSRLLFQRLVGFTQFRKQKRLDSVLSVPDLGSDKVVVLKRGSVLKKLIPSGTAVKSIPHKDLCSLNDVRAGRTNLNSRSLRTAVDFLEKNQRGGEDVQFLKDAQQHSWFSEEVVEIGSAGEQDVYDIVGAETGSFVVDGLVVHNCHINRVPYAGRLKYSQLEPISSRNLPMLMVEKALMQGKLDLSHLQYLKVNERFLNEIYNPRLDYTYFVIQIADKDVNCVTPFDVNQNSYFAQNERFSMIRWGSQVELCLPLDGRYKFSFVNEETDHVTAGMDKLVRVRMADGTPIMY